MLIENFGGFLNTAKKIISGDKSSAQMGSDVPADLYSAEAIRNMIITTANKVDNDKDNFLDLPLLTRYLIFNKLTFGKENDWGWHAKLAFRFLNEERIGGQ